MIPYSDPSEPNRIFPAVNLALIALNFIVFIFIELPFLAAGTGAFNGFIEAYGLVPCEYDIAYLGQHVAGCTVYSGTPQPLLVTMFTSMFMHAGWLHILGNMLFLWVFGDNIENSMGHVRYLIFYLLCGIGANCLEIATALTSHVPGLGASGAIAGVLAAYLMLYPTSRVRTLLTIAIIWIPVALPAFVLIGFWFLLQFVSGVTSLTSQAAQSGGVAYWAHVGGFVTGALFIWVFRHKPRVAGMQAYHRSWNSG